MTKLVIGDAPLTIDEVIAVARGGAEVTLGAPARERIQAAYAVVADVIAREQVAYGVTTGFGLLATTHIPVDKVQELQQNLVRSHAVGLGAPLSREVVRAAMTIRLNTMARGHSGVRLSVAEHLAACINADIIPWVPSRGSLGASGDLAPSAHLVLAMMGEGELLTEDGRREPSGPALQAAGLAPLSLEAKEGLSLLNGTQFMAAIGCMLVADGEALLDSADLIGAMSLEGLRASVGPFEERIQALRPIPGQLVTAANVRRATAGSAIMLSHLNCDKVQDAYSLRCIPQVHGACRDALAWLRRVIGVEVDAVTDNPLIFPDSGEIISAGNFHGEPLALALDLAAMSLAEIASISERRTFRMLTSSLSELPPFLTTDSGLNNGYMIAQYTAAALVSENKVLCHPASVDSIPSSGDQEDHVSMGMTAALKALDVLGNAQKVLGIEAVCAAQAIDLLAPLEPGPGTGAGRAVIREFAPTLGRDRYLAPELEAATEAVAAGRFAAIVREGTGAVISCDLLVRGASEVVTMVPGAGQAAPAGPGASVDLGVIARGAVAARDGRVVWTGPESEIAAALEVPDDARVVDVEGAAVVPGFVDAHAHLVWAGERAAEYGARLGGATYLEIQAGRRRHQQHGARDAGGDGGAARRPGRAPPRLLPAARHHDPRGQDRLRAHPRGRAQAAARRQGPASGAPRAHRPRGAPDARGVRRPR